MTEKKYLYWMAVSESEPVRFSELAHMMAKAMHPSDAELDHYGATRLNLDEDLPRAVRDGELVVRNPAGMGKHTFPHGAALQSAVMLPSDLQPFLAERGIELRLTAHGSGPIYWTLENAAIALQTQEGWHGGTRAEFLDQLQEAAQRGELTVREPRTCLPMKSPQARTYWEVVTPADLNAWREKQAARYRWNADATEAEPQVEETKVTYFYPEFARLQPRTPWAGGRMVNTDVLTLADAASMATKHAGEPVTIGDFLRAAARGEITLRAIVHRKANVQKHDGGIYCNGGQENENKVPAGAIATLPLTACQHLAAAGRASWRTFDGFEMVDGVLQRYTKGHLLAGEPDYETVPEDCRVMGYDVHALADEYTAPESTQAAPVVAENTSHEAAPLEMPMKKAALIAALEHEWESIEADLSEATRNGLKVAAHAGKHGEWYASKARAWAVSKGKIRQAAPVIHSAIWPGTVTRNRI